MTKLKWMIEPVPTGHYRSFDVRRWPTALIGDRVVARIQCRSAYRPADARSGRHDPLTVLVAQYMHSLDDRKKYGAFRWRRLNKRGATLSEAKNLAQWFFDEHPEFLEPVRGPDGQVDI